MYTYVLFLQLKLSARYYGVEATDPDLKSIVQRNRSVWCKEDSQAAQEQNGVEESTVQEVANSASSMSVSPQQQPVQYSSVEFQRNEIPKSQDSFDGNYNISTLYGTHHILDGVDYPAGASSKEAVNDVYRSQEDFQYIKNSSVDNEKREPINESKKQNVDELYVDDKKVTDNEAGEDPFGNLLNSEFRRNESESLSFGCNC